MPDFRLDAKKSRTNKTPNPGPPGSHSQLGQGKNPPSTLMETAKCHVVEGCGMLQEPTGESPKPGEGGERGHVQKAYPGGIKANLTLRLAGIYNTTKGGAKHSRQSDQHKQSLGV